MLLRFGVSNHRSIRTPQELSLAVSTLRDKDAGLIPCAAAESGRLLPAAIIYGANASGKSNLVSAFKFMQSAVLLSHKQGTPGGLIPRHPFVLDPKCMAGTSRFEVDFVHKGVRYHYGFEASDTEFEKEWLFGFPFGRAQSLFNRERGKYKFGRQLKGRNTVISDLTRPNSLFLSAALQNDHKQLSEIGSFFEEYLVFSELALDRDALTDYPVDERVIKFLKAIGTGVVGHRLRKIEIPELQSRMFQDIQQLVRSKYEQEIPSVPSAKNVLELGHGTVDGKTTYFDLNNESAGTRRLLLLLLACYHALDNGQVLILDELDASIHTQACEAMVNLFASKKTNKKGAQLIATTHDTNLLRSPELRRDQIWFAEKDSDGASHFYPLSDFRTRQDDNLEKGYLQGRYGAIPFNGPVDQLLGD